MNPYNLTIKREVQICKMFGIVAFVYANCGVYPLFNTVAFIKENFFN